MKVKLAREVELLSDISKAFAESLDLEETLTSILKSLDTHLNLRRGMITLLDPDTETINIRIAHGLSKKSRSQASYKVGEGITGLVVQSGKEIVVPDISKDPRFLHKTRSRKQEKGKQIAFFCVPIKLEGKTIGTLSVDKQADKSDDFKANVRLLDVIATMVAQAIKLNKLVESDRQKLREENVRLRRELKSHFDIHNMVGSSNAMKEVYRLIEQVANSNATVLLRGESGTGKDLVAHAIHYSSLRADKPFVKVNCTALPDTLLESELFGHEKGAFTNAIRTRIGRFELANGGTVFLDEIGDMNPLLQSKLLRVIQERQFERIGAIKTIKTDIRIVAATHQDLKVAVAQKKFREDLYYRLNVIPIRVPPLRERKTDIPLLAHHFLEYFNHSKKKSIRGFGEDSLELLMRYDWPGNVRELENTIERLVILVDNNIITPEDLPFYIKTSRTNSNLADFGSWEGMSYREQLDYAEKLIIKKALEECQGNKTHAARRLGFSVRTMRNKINKYNLN